MLVLTRKENEKIYIGNDIVVTVVRTGNGKVRLGIDAPPEMVVLRSELKKEESNQKTNQDSLKVTTIPFGVPCVKCS
jgi:carbon storage regulator